MAMPGFIIIVGCSIGLAVLDGRGWPLVTEMLRMVGWVAAIIGLAVLAATMIGQARFRSSIRLRLRGEAAHRVTWVGLSVDEQQLKDRSIAEEVHPLTVPYHPVFHRFSEGQMFVSTMVVLCFVALLVLPRFVSTASSVTLIGIGAIAAALVPMFGLYCGRMTVGDGQLTYTVMNRLTGRELRRHQYDLRRARLEIWSEEPTAVSVQVGDERVAFYNLPEVLCGWVLWAAFEPA